MKEFTWVRTGFSPLNYELHCDGRTIGSLAWLRGPRAAAVAETAGRILVLRRKGLLCQHIVVETITGEVVARASLPPLAKVGYVLSTDGKRYNFRLSDAGFPLTQENGQTEAIVDNSHSGWPIPLIIMFVGWYIHLSCRKIVNVERISAVSAIS